jgi:hypothetical protein
VVWLSRSWNDAIKTVVTSLKPRLLHPTLPATFKNLRELDLSNCRQPEAKDVRSLTALTNLQGLTLPILVQPAEEIVLQICQLSTLKVLDLSGYGTCSGRGVIP